MEDLPKAGDEAIDLEARVLVAVMNNPHDLDIARERGWYRIPFQRAPARVGADYLAFYHTAAFGREKWSISYYAPVCGYRIVTRRDLLPDEPDHPRAEEKYYRIDIGSLQELPDPIPSRKLRRITFISTTLSCLLAAKEIRDLWQDDLAEEQLWLAFRSGVADTETDSYLGEARWPYRVEPSRIGNETAVIELDAHRQFHVPHWFAVYFSPCHICDDSPSCLDMVRGAVINVTPLPHSGSPRARG